jgi:putative colanic acid biosynthesis UDP-glucose lipid carrier transferase
MQLTGNLKRYSISVGNVVRLIDAAVITGALVGSYLLSHDTRDRLPDYAAAGFLAAFAFLLIAEFTALYRSYRGDSRRLETIALIKTWIPAFVVVLIAGFMTKRSNIYSRIIISYWALCAPGLLIVLRILGRGLLAFARSMGFNYRSAVILGSGEQGARLARQILSHPESGIRLNGIYADTPPTYPLPYGVSCLGTIEDAALLASRSELDIAYIALPTSELDQVDRIADALADSAVSLHVVPTYAAMRLFQSPVSLVGDIPVLSIFDTPMQGVDGLLKKLEDILLAAILTFLCAIPMLLIAIAIKLTSRGPILFRQRRYGIGGQEIDVLKFRSMYVRENGDSGEQATRNDARITPVGRFLRRSSLDELPQLFNVLQGSMSLVGPRPHAVKHNEQYRTLIHGYMLRHKVKPGITGLAQIRGFRGATDTLDKMEMRVESDLEYIRSWSLALDIKILIATLFIVINGKNAY